MTPQGHGRLKAGDQQEGRLLLREKRGVRTASLWKARPPGAVLPDPAPTAAPLGFAYAAGRLGWATRPQRRSQASSASPLSEPATPHPLPDWSRDTELCGGAPRAVLVVSGAMAALRALLRRVGGPLWPVPRCPAVRPFASGECGPVQRSITLLPCLTAPPPPSPDPGPASPPLHPRDPHPRPRTL